MDKEFISERHVQENLRRERLEAFDYLIDTALDGLISIAEALQEYKTLYGVTLPVE